jgi:hypothetical protein
LNPKPSKEEIDDHAGNIKSHPAREIQFRRAESSAQLERLVFKIIYRTLLIILSYADNNWTSYIVAYSCTIPFRANWGEDPIKDPVPPIFEAYAVHKT